MTTETEKMKDNWTNLLREGETSFFVESLGKALCAVLCENGNPVETATRFKSYLLAARVAMESGAGMESPDQTLLLGQAMGQNTYINAGMYREEDGTKNDAPMGMRSPLALIVQRGYYDLFLDALADGAPGNWHNENEKNPVDLVTLAKKHEKTEPRLLIVAAMAARLWRLMEGKTRIGNEGFHDCEKIGPFQERVARAGTFVMVQLGQTATALSPEQVQDPEYWRDQFAPALKRAIVESADLKRHNDNVVAALAHGDKLQKVVARLWGEGNANTIAA